VHHCCWVLTGKSSRRGRCVTPNEYHSTGSAPSSGWSCSIAHHNQQLVRLVVIAYLLRWLPAPCFHNCKLQSCLDHMTTAHVSPDQLLPENLKHWLLAALLAAAMYTKPLPASLSPA
jgi:hypothetical protein